MKNIHFRGISDEVYFKALECKAKLKCENWEQMFERIFSGNWILNAVEEKKFEEDKKKAWAAWSNDVDRKLKKTREEE